MANGHHSAELRLPVGMEGADLLRAFEIRELTAFIERDRRLVSGLQ